MEPEEFDKMFSNFDSSKVEMQVAAKAISDLYKGLRENGLNVFEAALLTAQIVMPSTQRGQSDGESDSE